MNLAVIGGVLGAAAAGGLLLVVLYAPPLRRMTLADRIAPYLGDAALPSRLLSPTAPTGTTFGRLIAPVIGELVVFLDKLVGGQTSVRRRLGALNSPMTVLTGRVAKPRWRLSSAPRLGRPGSGANMAARASRLGSTVSPAYTAAASTAVDPVGSGCPCGAWQSGSTRCRERHSLPVSSSTSKTPSPAPSAASYRCPWTSQVWAG